jgi:DNA excision repair protein ERCC-4
MCSSDRTVLQLRQYLTTMQKTDPPFNGEAGRRMMNTLFLSNWQHERIGSDFLSGEERDELHDKRMEGLRTVPAPPTYKRRRTRGGHLQSLAARMPKEMEL